MAMQIRKLTLTQFRGFKTFEWRPHPGVNCLIGPGDAGKSSILDAVALALIPAPPPPAVESDYHGRIVEDGFRIDLVVGGLSAPIRAGFYDRITGWDASSGVVVDAPTEGLEEIIQVRLTGTPDLELQHTLVTPNGTEETFGAAKRQQFGLCLFRSGRTGGRDFRMSRGSLLQRMLGHDELRGLATQAMREAAHTLAPPPPIAERLASLHDQMESAGVQGDLSLGLLSSPGANVLANIGLFAGDPEDDALPLAYRGQGTQQIAAFVLARALAREQPIVVLDELEVALEPYRQRQLVRELRELMGVSGQAFISTHSPAVIDELDVEDLVRVEPAATAGIPATPRVFGGAVASLKQDDPEAFLCRIPVICEGATEVGLLEELLGSFAAAEHVSLDALGVRLVDGGGQPRALSLAEELMASGMEIGVFLDDETEFSGRRAKLAASGACAAGLSAGRCTEVAVAASVSLDALKELLKHPGSDGSNPYDRRIQRVTERLGKQGRPTLAELVEEHGEALVRKAVGEAAHASPGWFKSREGGRLLGQFLVVAEGGDAVIGDIKSLWLELSDRLQLGRSSSPSQS